MMRIPGWLTETARPAHSPVPWAGIGLGAIAVGVPLVAGLAAGQPVTAVLVALGGVIGVTADRFSPYPVRLRRVAFAGILGAAGLLLGAVIGGHGWLAVAVMMLVAGVSALLSSISATWSTAGMFLLVYAILGTGPIGGLRPMWGTSVWILAGAGWTLVLMVPGWLRHPRAAEQTRVAAAYRALAANMRAPGIDGFSATRQGVATALNVAYEELLGQRAAVSGRDRRLARLVAVLNQARLIADATAALIYAGEQAPPQAAAQADKIAAAVLTGSAVPGIGRPPAASAGMLALYDTLGGASRMASGGKAVPGDDYRVPVRRGPWRTLVEQVGGEFAPTFAIRLMLCVGVATVCSEALPLQRSYWVPLAVAVVLKPDFGSVFARAWQYAAGTAIGAACGAVILSAYPSDAVLLVPAVVFAALLPYGMSRNYGLFGAFFSALVILLIDLLTHGGWRLAEARFIDILLGCGIALVVGYAPWPSSWHAHVPRDLAAAIDEAARYLELALHDREPGLAASAHLRARRELGAVRVEFQRTLAEPLPVRERVAVWWPAVIALESLLEAIPATAINTAANTAVTTAINTAANAAVTTAINTAGRRPPVAAVSELATALRQVATAVRTGRPLPPQGRLPRPPSLELVSDAVRSVVDTVAGTPPGLPAPAVP
jgi:uncharacterized membrane protein YccC